MSISINVIQRTDKINRNQTAPIHIRLTHKSKSRYVSTGITLPLEVWNADTQQISHDYPSAGELQFQINNKRREYEKKIKRLEALEIEVTFDTLFEANNRKVNCTLSDCFMRKITRLESLGKYNTASKVKVAFSLISQFRNPIIRLEEIDLAYLNDLELFLRKRGNTDNCIATRFSVFKAVYNKALAEELFTPKSNPFVRFKVGRLWTPTRKRAITKEELQRLINLEIPEKPTTPYLALAKDIFLFTYYTAGINIGDIAHLTRSNIVNGRLCYKRRKTGKDINCVLMPVASEIIAKYDNPTRSDYDFIFPILDKAVHMTDLQRFNRIHKITSKVNRALGELARMAKITTHLTTYCARHTYASVLKRSGVNIAIISESLGHSDLATTQIYLDSFENSQIDEAMKNLI